ncbi:hypothetical protein ACFZA8_07920 [Streptomyces tsukubensis]
MPAPGDRPAAGYNTGDGNLPDTTPAPGRRRRPGFPPGDGSVAGDLPGPEARPQFGSGPASGDGTRADSPFTPGAGPRRNRRADRFGAGTGEVPVPPPYTPPAPPAPPVPPVSPPPEATPRRARRAARPAPLPGEGPGTAPFPAPAAAPRSLPRESPAVRFGPVAAGLVALLATLLPDGNPLRWLPVVLFLVAGPGIAVLRVCEPRLRRDSAVGPEDDWEHGFSRDSDRLELLMLAVFLSVSLVVLGATALIALKFFSGTGLLLLLTGTTAVAAACPRLPEGRHRYETPATPPQEG